MKVIYLNIVDCGKKKELLIHHEHFFYLSHCFQKPSAVDASKCANKWERDKYLYCLCQHLLTTLWGKKKNSVAWCKKAKKHIKSRF